MLGRGCRSWLAPGWEAGSRGRDGSWPEPALGGARKMTPPLAAERDSGGELPQEDALSYQGLLGFTFTLLSVLRVPKLHPRCVRWCPKTSNK